MVGKQGMVRKAASPFSWVRADSFREYRHDREEAVLGPFYCIGEGGGRKRPRIRCETFKPGSINSLIGIMRCVPRGKEGQTVDQQSSL